MAEQRELVERLKAARTGGSSADDTEWDDIRERQAAVEVAILKIQQELRQADIVDPQKLDTSVVSVGMAVKLVDPADPSAPARVYAIVGDGESDPARKRITAQSPMGAKLMGRRAGDLVTVSTPGGVRSLKVVGVAVAPVS